MRQYPLVPTRTLLVRHCESAVDPLSPPETWSLTERGLRQAKSLVRLTSGPAVVLAGNEPKMLQTVEPLAQVLGAEVQRHPEMNESHSEGWLEDDQFLNAVRRFLEDPTASPAPGWETADAAADRFVRKLGQIIGDSHEGTTVVACSGGRVLTAALRRMNLVTSDDAYAMWRDIGMPDVAEVEWDDGHPVLRSRFGSRRLHRD